MSALTGSQINQSYQGLLKLADSTTGITAGHQAITDGEGNDTGTRIGQNFFQPPWGISHYELQPNDYYGTGIGGSVVNPTASQINNTTVTMFYDRGIESYSAVTWNVWTTFDSNEKIDYAFYKLGFLEGYGYVATDRVSPVYSFTGVTSGGGFQQDILESPLSFSGTGPGLYGLAIVYSTDDGTLTGRLTSQSISPANLQLPLNGNLGFVRNTINNAAPTFFASNTSGAFSSYTLSGTSLPSSYTLSNYPQTSWISASQGGFLLDTIK